MKVTGEPGSTPGGDRLPLGRPRRRRANSRLPGIIVSGRRMRDITADAWDAVEQTNSPPWIFQRGRVLTTIVPDDSGYPTLRALDAAALKGILDRVANFSKLDDRRAIPARPPTDVVTDMMSTESFPLPILRGVVETPVFAPSRELVSKSGYHEETGMFLYFPERTLARGVPDRPSAGEMALARSIIFDELLGDFPFVGDADLANAVATLLLPFVRLMMDGPTPIHVVESPTPGTGKGLLAEVVCIPSLGRGPAIMTEARDEDEWRKRLTAKLLQGPLVVLLDNVKHRLDSAALSAALTAETWEDRILGESRVVRLPITCTWLATANNPSLSLEVARRVVPIRIDSGLEKPSERKGFRHPKLARWARRNRGKLVWSALTLVQGWIAAGAPSGEETMGSYDEYTEVMGGILRVAGIPGFLTNRDRVYDEAEQELAAWEGFCTAWWEELGDRPVKAQQLLPLATERGLLSDRLGDLKENGGATKLGVALSKMRDRVVGGYRVRVGKDSNSKVATYRLELV